MSPPPAPSSAPSAVAELDGRPLWAIAQYHDGERRVPWAVSQTEIERAMGAWVAPLRALGLGPGRRVLWCSTLAEGAHLWPLLIASMLVGAPFSLADATSADALRVAMFLRRLPFHAVFGVDDAVLDGLDELGRPYAEVFADVPVVGARPGAYERLEGAGLTPHLFVLAGPAVAIAARAGGPAVVDADEWELAVGGDRLVVSSLLPRATTFARTPTAIRADLVDPHSFVPRPPAAGARKEEAQ